MKIGLLGFDIVNANKGCEALTYSFISLMDSISNEKLEVYSFGEFEFGFLKKSFPNIDFYGVKAKFKNPKLLLGMIRKMHEMDYMFDITHGDGFSDIYSPRYNAITDLKKALAIHFNHRLILMPQTYGPFNNKLLKKWAVSLTKRSLLAFSRDKQSAVEMNKEIGKKKVQDFTDLAFLLPYNDSKEKKQRSIGFNVSSTLWDSQHMAHIALKTNYQYYCRTVTKKLVEMGFDVYLIPHVVDPNNYDSPENDSKICDQLCKENPALKRAPDFNTPIEAKTFISTMEIFIGARMHATIGAFSSNVITIPFAYSKKFEGLYGSLNYNYIVDARMLNTEEAIVKTMSLIEKRVQLKEAQNESLLIVRKKITQIKEKLKKVVFEDGKN